MLESLQVPSRPPHALHLLPNLHWDRERTRKAEWNSALQFMEMSLQPGGVDMGTNETAPLALECSFYEIPGASQTSPQAGVKDAVGVVATWSRWRPIR